MEKEQIVDNIITSLRSEVSQFISEESSITDSIEYEERVLAISRKLARTLITQTKGQLPKSRNGKKVLTSFGRFELKKGHVLLKGTSKFGISQRVQELLCTVGQSVVYQEASELFERLMSLNVCAPQIQRVCLHYGAMIDSAITANCESVIPALDRQGKSDALYIMVDGCMLYTRQHEWKELKLGRIFYQNQVVNIHERRKEILRSVYVSHLGSVDEFFPKFERHLVGYDNRVIIDYRGWCKMDMELGGRQLPWGRTSAGLLSRQRETGHFGTASVQGGLGTLGVDQGTIGKTAQQSVGGSPYGTKKM